MKNVFSVTIIVLFALMLFVGCRNSDDDLDNSVLVGTWNWISTDGGINNQIHETPANTGKTIKLTFTSDNTYKIDTNGTVTSEGTYTLYKNVSSLDHVERIFIDFSNTPDKMIRNNDGNNLYLEDDFPDGIGSHYQK